MVWKAVQSKVDQNELLLTPLPFQAGEIAKKIGNIYPVADIQRTLELFERMTLIVRISYEGIPFYRLLTKADLEKGGTE